MPIVQGDPYAIAKVLRKGRTNTNDDNDAVGKPLVRALQTVLSQPGSGRIYTTKFFTKDGKVIPYGVRPPHAASAPGSPPAKDSGYLYRSIHHRGIRERSGASVDVFTTADYGVYLEYGTHRMLPRPWFRPTMFKARLTAARPWVKGIERRERMEARRLGGRG